MRPRSRSCTRFAGSFMDGGRPVGSCVFVFGVLGATEAPSVRPQWIPDFRVNTNSCSYPSSLDQFRKQPALPRGDEEESIGKIGSDKDLGKPWKSWTTGLLEATLETFLNPATNPA